MLPGSGAVKAVYLDPHTGILAGAAAAVTAAGSSAPEPKLIMECGTIETDTILSVAKASQEISTAKLSDSLTFVDAPVSGGPMGAQDGTLTFMVGCAPAASSRVFPVVQSYLQHMGNRDGIFLCGDVGAGTAFKIINNYLSAITSLAASEALNIGVKAGLDPKLLTEVINASGGQCWVTSKSNPCRACRRTSRAAEATRAASASSCAPRCWAWAPSWRRWWARGRCWMGRPCRHSVRPWLTRGTRGRTPGLCISGSTRVRGASPRHEARRLLYHIQAVQTT